MPARLLTPDTIKPHLKGCGYREQFLEKAYRFHGGDGVDVGEVPLAAFSGTPFDARSACINVVEAREGANADVSKVRNTGAPVVFRCCADKLEWWKQTTDTPTHEETIPAKDIDRFFKKKVDDFAPDRIYEAKTRGRLTRDTQLHFVDIGLMPMVERDIGNDLSRLVERVISRMEETIRRPLKSKKDIETGFKSAFWLLAAKLLRDKKVPNFKTIRLSDVDDVFRRVGNHYGDTHGLPPGGKRWRAAIEEAAATIDEFGFLGAVSTEALAYLYENTLVPKPVRETLGIHSTPSQLVDYMVWQLWPWIEEIPTKDRHVFEPACGHAAFLVGAMRLLRQWSSLDDSEQGHRYLRDHLHGVEIDPFALEIAKLSLTLADVPHGNSWDLRQGDMFEGDVLREGAEKCRILLANPPYRKFSPEEQAMYRQSGNPVAAWPKAYEMLSRTIPHLEVGSVFGIVAPHGTLYSTQLSKLRETLVREFEIIEIASFADNLFGKSDHETAIILGRRDQPATGANVRYRRVREKDMAEFKKRFAFSDERKVPQAQFVDGGAFDLRFPELEEVWAYLKSNPTLSSMVRIGQGFSFKGKENRSPEAETLSKTKRRGWIKCFVLARGDWPIHSQPGTQWMNPDPAVIQTRRMGLETGAEQLLVNHARGGRGPWTLRAWIDRDGNAVKGNFLAVRPRAQTAHLEYVWALLNCPLANAYVYTHTSKRHIIASDLESLPIPVVSSLGIGEVLNVARHYLTVAAHLQECTVGETTDDSVRQILLRMDAEVLKLYDLPPRLERQLLDLFEGVERKGVGCRFRGYYPEGLDAYVPLHELISEEYERSTLDAFLERHKPTKSPEVLAALRAAAAAYAEE